MEAATETTKSTATSTEFTLTEPAQAAVWRLISAEGNSDLALRVAVRPGGCSGFSYEMYFDGDRTPSDKVLSYGVDGSRFQVLIDEASAPLLVGATLEYQDSLSKSGFSVSNSNASRTCGCGQSFS
jgi:iron-sulfur cluster assembly protein/iron-sulfur cluster insertion protein